MAADVWAKVKEAVSDLEEAVESGHFGNVRTAAAGVCAAVTEASNPVTVKSDG